MNIETIKDGTVLTVKLVGWLDTTTSPQLSEFLQKELDGITSLNLDFAELEYVSSAGLRVLLSTQKVMNKKGKMAIYHANDDILEMFDFTGFGEIFTLID